MIDRRVSSSTSGRTSITTALIEPTTASIRSTLPLDVPARVGSADPRAGATAVRVASGTS